MAQPRYRPPSERHDNRVGAQAHRSMSVHGSGSSRTTNTRQQYVPLSNPVTTTWNGNEYVAPGLVDPHQYLIQQQPQYQEQTQHPGVEQRQLQSNYYQQQQQQQQYQDDRQQRLARETAYSYGGFEQQPPSRNSWSSTGLSEGSQDAGRYEYHDRPIRDASVQNVSTHASHGDPQHLDSSVDPNPSLASNYQQLEQVADYLERSNNIGATPRMYNPEFGTNQQAQQYDLEENNASQYTYALRGNGNNNEQYENGYSTDESAQRPRHMNELIDMRSFSQSQQVHAQQPHGFRDGTGHAALPNSFAHNYDYSHQVQDSRQQHQRHRDNQDRSSRAHVTNGDSTGRARDDHEPRGRSRRDRR